MAAAAVWAGEGGGIHPVSFTTYPPTLTIPRQHDRRYCSTSGERYKLEIALTVAVDPDGVKAKFKKKLHCILLTLPFSDGIHA